jgi:hypothetical protein
MRISQEKRLKVAKMIPDMIAYVEWAVKGGTSGQVVATILHDVMGTLDGQEFFLPRTSGFAQTRGDAFSK